MSIAAVQAPTFYEQVIAEDRVFTFLAQGNFLVFPVAVGEVVPFWSSRARLDQVTSQHAKYRAYTADEIRLPEFLAKTLPLLRREKIRIGVNWSGARLTGYDIAVEELERNLHYRLTESS